MVEERNQIMSVLNSVKGQDKRPGGPEPVHTALGRPHTDRDQSVILVTLMPRMEIDKAGGNRRQGSPMNSLRSALTAAPTSQRIPTIRGIRVTSKTNSPRPPRHTPPGGRP